MLWCRKSRYSCCNDNEPKHTSFVDDSDWEDEDEDDDDIDDAKNDDWLSPKLTTSTQSSSPDAYPYKARSPRTPSSPPGEYPYTARNLQKDFSPSDPFSPKTSFYWSRDHSTRGNTSILPLLKCTKTFLQGIRISIFLLNR